MTNIQGLLDKYKKIDGERFFSETFEEKEYEGVFDKPAGTIIDIGALAGEFGAYMYDKADTIYAIEPYNAYYEELVANIKEFGLDKMKPFNYAIGGENKVGWINHDSRGGNHLMDDDKNYQSIEIKTLATFMHQQAISHVDILKIDIEGLEEKVFNAPDCKAILPNIDVIIGEHLKGLEQLFLDNGFIQTPTKNQNIIFSRSTL